MNIRDAINALICTIAVVLTAGDPVVIIQPDGTGVYWDGQSDTATIVRVIRTTDAPPPSPPDPPPPPQPPSPPDGGSFADRVEKLARDVNQPAGARIMAAYYGLIAGKISDGTIPADSAEVSRAIDATLLKTLSVIPETANGPDPDLACLEQALRAERAAKLSGKQLEWRAVHRAIIDDISTRLVAGGGSLSRDQWVAEFRAAQSGCEAAAGERADSDWLDLIITTLIKLLITLIEGVFDA